MVTQVVVADPVRVTTGGSLAVEDFADIGPTCTAVTFDGGALVVAFDTDLTAEQTLRVRIRCVSRDPDAEALLVAAASAYDTNLDYLALNPPTTAQALAQVRTLTQQVNGLLRFVTRL